MRVAIEGDSGYSIGMSSNDYPIAFTGGGTGGHVYPARPIMDLILTHNPGRTLYWIGSSTGIEKEIVEEWNIPYFGIPSGKLRRYFDFKNFTDLFRIVAGFFAARRVLRKNRPAFLFSKGGFVSVPPVLAARSLGILVYTHDSDVTPGLATRINSRFVNKIFLPYQESVNHTSLKYREKCIVSGNPVRHAFFSGDGKKGRAYLGISDEMPLLMVFGGSLGARQLNSLVEDNLDELTKICYVVHQMGPLNYRPLEKKNYHPVPYLNEELYDLMAAADGALSRAGANFLWEMTAGRTPMLLLPLGAGSRGDQAVNARIFKEAGAARILEEKQLNPQYFMDEIRTVLDRDNRIDWESVGRFLNLGQAEETILQAIGEDLGRAF